MFMDMLNLGTLLNNVVLEVEANELTVNQKLRFPNFLKIRKDKTHYECTADQLDS